MAGSNLHTDQAGWLADWILNNSFKKNFFFKVRIYQYTIIIAFAVCLLNNTFCQSFHFTHHNASMDHPSLYIINVHSPTLPKAQISPGPCYLRSSYSRGPSSLVCGKALWSETRPMLSPAVQPLDAFKRFSVVLPLPTDDRVRTCGPVECISLVLEIYAPDKVAHFLTSTRRGCGVDLTMVQTTTESPQTHYQCYPHLKLVTLDRWQLFPLLRRLLPGPARVAAAAPALLAVLTIARVQQQTLGEVLVPRR